MIFSLWQTIGSAAVLLWVCVVAQRVLDCPIFSKMGLSGWKALVPGYARYVQWRRALSRGWGRAGCAWGRAGCAAELAVIGCGIVMELSAVDSLLWSCAVLIAFGLFLFIDAVSAWAIGGGFRMSRQGKVIFFFVPMFVSVVLAFFPTARWHGLDA